MSTDYRMTRTALGVRLRELRTACPGGRLTGSEPAARPGWEQSRISELENGRQTATPEDLRLRAVATGHPGTYDELQARLQGFESHVRARVAEPGRGGRWLTTTRELPFWEKFTDQCRVGNQTALI